MGTPTALQELSLTSVAISAQRRAAIWLPAAIGVVALIAFSREDGTVLCPYRRCTGGYCPLCGATRSIGMLTKLDFWGALRLYPALPFIAAMAALRFIPLPLSPAARRNGMLIAAAMVGAIWLTRIALGHVPAPTMLQWPI